MFLYNNKALRMKILPVTKFNDECKNFRIVSEPGKKGIRESDSRGNWLDQSIKYREENGNDHFLNIRRSFNDLGNDSYIHQSNGQRDLSHISGKDITRYVANFNQNSPVTTNNLCDLKISKGLNDSGLIHEKLKQKVPPSIENSTKRSKAEKILRGLTAPVTAPMMAVGGVMLAIGRVGVCGPLALGAKIGVALVPSRPSSEKTISEQIATIIAVCILFFAGMCAAGVIALPIIITSAAIGLIGTGLFFCGGSILAPDFTKQTMNDYTPFGSHSLEYALLDGMIDTMKIFSPKKRKEVTD